MVEIDLVYEGDLHCRMRHGPSGAEIATDAPVDNHGQGEAFSSTDLVAAGLASCVMTVMAIFASRKEVDLKGSRARVAKEMVTGPQRRIRRLALVVDLPGTVPMHLRPALEAAAHTCPVERSLHPDVEVDLTIRYGA